MMVSPQYRISLSFGALSPSIKDQLAEIGLHAPSSDMFEKVRVSLCTLRIQGYIPRSTHDAACKKLIGAIAKEARPLAEMEAQS